ncbi:CDP-diacylglycerol--glycerol-3-phosphate 3-phosphatidyltransferase [Candidatus Bandiella euplotis]|uniref:CDP-diacylglycerol--glycerol-3-phosphate 3-phosphatidyltransferase n=1 Tax=Candidatus Bandiella euplotis TaxID=1664265 RepID=A0ABZ0UPX0_9RICK|nr:CDP-diacylglycerol--glycerol-3-phosphate 3-phosphatidyltransferase [Candidatus Bandiella woodruffii]WPX96748.1 CDP-diacylglycerol--glycerol-3-phosphate 3-phosphatidyltransferase [Candidatus Bandiella woodruffii]
MRNLDARMQKNIPNILTLLRILLIPVLVAVFYIESKFAHYVAVSIFIFASITDYFDGALARAWKVQSDFGKVLDPIADKLLVAATLMMMVDKGIAPVLPTLVILCREILVSGMREHLAELKVQVSLPVSRLAKIKTAAQMAAIIILLLGENTTGFRYTDLLGKVAIWTAAVLTAITGYAYLQKGIKNGSVAIR